MEFFRQEYSNGLPFPSPGDLPDPGIESPALTGRFFTTSTTWEPAFSLNVCSRASTVFKLRSHNGLGQKWLLLCQESLAWFCCSGEPLPHLLRRCHSVTFATFHCWQSQVSRYSSRGHEFQTVGLWRVTLESLGTLLKEAPWHYTGLLGALNSPHMWMGEIRNPVWAVHEGIWSPK